MSSAFTFALQIDYTKLNKMMDEFLKQHSQELTAMIGKCLMLGNMPTTTTTPPPQEQEQLQTDIRIDKRPLIGDSIPDDPFSNMFPNPNANTTRAGDRRL